MPLGGKSIAVMGGLKLFGCPQEIPFALLQEEASMGMGSLTLDRDVEGFWAVGDEVVIAPTSFDGREREIRTISGVSGNFVTLSSPLNYTHHGIDETTGIYGHFGAEVSHLSRNIKVNGIADSEDLFGGRIVVVKSDDGSSYRRGWAQIDNVELTHMGQFGHNKALDYRAPIAFYHLGLQDPLDDQRSFVSGSSIHDSYNGGIVVGDGADGIPITDNVFANNVESCIVVFGDSAVITGNIITFVEYRLLYQNLYLSELLGNAEPENVYLPAGVDTMGTYSVTVENNRVSGVDGPAFRGHGKACSSRDLCQTSSTTGPRATISNIGHSSMRGYSIVKKFSRPCVEYSGFFFWRMGDYGIYTQAKKSEIHIHSNIFVDNIISICNIIVTMNEVTAHEHGEMMASIDNNLFVGQSDKFTCEDFDKRESTLIVSSGMTHMNRAPYNPARGMTSIYLPFFSVGPTKFPKRPMHDHREATYNALNGRSCASGNQFVNFDVPNGSSCAGRYPIAVSSNEGTIDHTHTVEISNTEVTNSRRRNLLFLHRPRLGDITLANCIDMSCDGPKKVMLKDLDGTLTGTGSETSIFGQSE